MRCGNYGTELVAEYCHACGQAALPIRRDTVGFLKDPFFNFLGADYRLLRTLARLVVSPGRLTTEWIDGHRTRYTAPAQLYLFVAGAFFLLNAYHPFVRFKTTDLSVKSSLSGLLVKSTSRRTKLRS